MSVTQISKATLSRSHLAESRLVQANQSDGKISTSLVRVNAPNDEARGWKITLLRPERKDGRPPLAVGAGKSSALFTSQNFGYAAGEIGTPTDPPARDNPVAKAGADVDPIFVELAWGMGGAQPARLVAHWPMLGASITVFGAYAEVFSGTFLAYNPGQSQDDLPVLSATIAPLTGNERAEASDELSLVQFGVANIGYAAAGDPVCLYVPDYARRVRVVAVDPSTDRPFDFGQPRVNFEWFDDNGPAVIDCWQQGGAVGIAPEWVDVPAAATVLRLGTPGPSIDCNEPAFTSVQMMVHWRVAP